MKEKIKLELSELTEKELKYYKDLDSTVYGKEISIKVADKLKEIGEVKNSREKFHFSLGIAHGHRDYCGHYLIYVEGIYYLGISEVDGYTDEKDALLKFESKDKFIDWLSKESDQSMSLYGEKFNNQTISKIRLEYLLDLNNFGNSNWNDFCRYTNFRLYKYEKLTDITKVKKAYEDFETLSEKNFYSFHGQNYNDIYGTREHIHKLWQKPI